MNPGRGPYLGYGDSENRGDGIFPSGGTNEMGIALPFVDFDLLGLGTGKSIRFAATGMNVGCVVLTTNELVCWGIHFPSPPILTEDRRGSCRVERCLRGSRSNSVGTLHLAAN